MSRLVTVGIMAVATLGISSIASTLAAAEGSGNETVNYTYDVRGRLVKVEHAGTLNNNVLSTYAFDKTDNRVNVNMTGAP